MAPDDSRCRVCCRGLYSCHWRDQSNRKRRHACCWFSVVTLVSLLMLCWIYICLVTFNDREDVNWKAFKELKWWVNWFMVVIIISALLTSYCVLLLLFALFQVALREPLDLHWLHKIFLILGAIIVTLGIAAMIRGWPQEWPTVSLSLQATAPFLQIGAVGALTLLSWFVFQRFHRVNSVGSKILIATAFAAVSAAIFLCPLLIHSPCLIELSELPPKPNLIGHRGAPMLAPENTMMSFRRSVMCNVTAFETDVQLSQDGVPFLMHDNESGFLMRTTNVKERFPDRDFNNSNQLTWEVLQSLNAGNWFLKADPFHSVSQLSAEEKETARNQSIPSLLQLLGLAQQHNISVIFDLKTDDEGNDTVRTVEAILESGIAQGLILWLPHKNRQYVMETAPGFIQVYNNISLMDEERGNHLNLKYSSLSTAEIRELRSKNVSVNLWVVNERWLFSLLWCSGAGSVTTNSCHLLQDMNQPDWTLAPRNYKIIWLAVDVASFLIMCILFISTRKRCCSSHTIDAEKPCSSWNERELSPFLPSE